MNKNEAEEKTGTFKTSLVKVNEAYFPMIEAQLQNNQIHMSGYQRQCVMNAISAINNTLQAANVDWNDPQLDQSNLTEILLTVASLELNAAASPREVFFKVRNVKFGKGKDERGRDIVEWKKQIDLGIEGDGNDKILRRFGADIKKVGQYWLVREGDEWEYPEYTGFDVIPPKWKPKGVGDVVRVVYPIMKNDGTVEYHIAERADVIRNLIAHMSQNMMWETFGIVQDKQKASWADKKEIDAKKAEILRKVQEMGKEKGLEAVLDCPEFQPWISPAWTEPHSREGMLIRKMRNNATKKIPKDFGNAFVEMIHNNVVDAEYTEIRQEIAAHANREPIDIEPEPINEKSEPEPTVESVEAEIVETQEEPEKPSPSEEPEYTEQHNEEEPVAQEELDFEQKEPEPSGDKSRRRGF